MTLNRNKRSSAVQEATSHLIKITSFLLIRLSSRRRTPFLIYGGHSPKFPHAIDRRDLHQRIYDTVLIVETSKKAQFFSWEALPISLTQSWFCLLLFDGFIDRNSTPVSFTSGKKCKFCINFFVSFEMIPNFFYSPFL